MFTILDKEIKGNIRLNSTTTEQEKERIRHPDSQSGSFPWIGRKEKGKNKTKTKKKNNNNTNKLRDISKSPTVKCFKNWNGEVSEKQMTQRPKHDRIVTHTPNPERSFYFRKLALPASNLLHLVGWVTCKSHTQCTSGERNYRINASKRVGLISEIQ